MSVKESIKIPGSVKEIRKISSRIVDLLMAHGVDKGRMFDIRLSVEEAVINAIEHGNKKDESLAVSVSFDINEKRIVVEVEDEGDGFNYAALPDPTLDKNILRSHGRGIYLIYKLMDKVEYNDKGNMIRLIKYLA